jgi:hypothetical protein
VAATPAQASRPQEARPAGPLSRPISPRPRSMSPARHRAGVLEHPETAALAGSRRLAPAGAATALTACGSLGRRRSSADDPRI